MSKLFKLKEWLSVEETARHLSIVFGENVSEADVLRLALDGHMKLSVRFVNLQPAQLTIITPTSLSCFPGFETENIMFDNQGIESFLPAHNEIVFLEGVFNVPMIFGSRLDIERKCRTIAQGEILEASYNDGVIVERDGRFFELQSKCTGDRLIPSGTPGHLVILHMERESAIEGYYASFVFPVGSALVVRTDALREFEQSINGEMASVDKPLSTTERNTLLTIIAALCDRSGIKHQERGTAQRIMEMTDEIGAHVDDGTIRTALAKIPDALETRMK